MNAFIHKATLFGGMVLLTNSALAADPEVSFYGLIDVYAVSAKPPAADDGTFAINPSGMTTSFLGVSTKIDAGGGLKGVAVIEGFLRPDTGEAGRYGGDPFFARDAFVGLEGGFGSVMLGRNTTPYFISVISTNPFGGSFGFGPSIKQSFLGGLNGDSAWSNTLTYSSPATRGFSGTLMYSAGEIAGDTATDKIGANVFYNAGAVSATVAYQSVDAQADDVTAPVDDTQSATMLGAKYALSGATVFAQYLIMTTEVAAGDTDFDTYQIGAAVNAGKGKVLVSYAHTDIGDADTTRDTAAVGYDQNFTDKIDLYAVFYYDDQSAIGDGNSVAVGGRFRF